MSEVRRRMRKELRRAIGIQPKNPPPEFGRKQLSLWSLWDDRIRASHRRIVFAICKQSRRIGPPWLLGSPPGLGVRQPRLRSELRRAGAASGDRSPGALATGRLFGVDAREVRD